MDMLRKITEIPANRLQSALHLGNSIMLIEDDNSYSFLNSSFTLRDYVVLTILEQGKIAITINGILNQIFDQQGVIYHLPEQIFRTTYISEDYRSKNILISRSFFKDLQIDQRLELFNTLKKQPFMPLQPESFQAILDYYSITQRILNQIDNPHQLEMLQHITKAYFLAFNYYFHRQQIESTPFTREERIAQQFLALVNKHYMREHGVQFYADKLRLTAKYISQCVRKTTELSAKECINQQIIAYAEQMLICTQVSISEISYMLSFEDLTAFGKFFKLHTGLSPREYRKKNSRNF